MEILFIVLGAITVIGGGVVLMGMLAARKDARRQKLLETTAELVNDALIAEDEPKTGMWCRMCGGACDLENCGMEQP
jgi:uncharacterized protein YebE (UPF0316 family)